MDLLIGGFVGCIVAVGVWWISRRFLRHYRGESDDGQPDPWNPSLPEPLGGVPVLLAVLQAGMALWGGYAWRRAESTGHAAAALTVTALLATVTVVDFRVRRIPDLLSLGLAAWGVVQMIWLGQPTPRSLALGVAAGGGLFLLIALAKRGAMGAGDVKFATALGAVLGYPLVLHGLFWGIVVAGLAALALLATGRAGRKDTMAYGPYLALGAWLVWTRSIGLWP
jgi:prepilin signal peptidase PulO-like enzyme (type II secretory pathway)